MGEGDPPVSRIFLPPPLERSRKKKEKGKFGGEVEIFLTFTTAMQPKIGSFGQFLAKLAVLRRIGGFCHQYCGSFRQNDGFSNVWRAFSYIAFLPPPGDFDRGHEWLQNINKDSLQAIQSAATSVRATETFDALTPSTSSRSLS